MSVSEPVYLHYLSALLEGDKNLCTDIVLKLLHDNTQPKEIYENIIHRSMYRIGELWDKCRLSIAEEHIASDITKEILSLIRLNCEKPKSINKNFAITCVQKEHHEIGAKLIADYVESKGWNAVYLGANIPHKELLVYIKEHKPDLVGISNNFYMNVAKLLELLDMIKSNLPDQKIIIGGQGPSNCQIKMIRKYPGIMYINNLNELDNYLTEFRN